MRNSANEQILRQVKVFELGAVVENCREGAGDGIVVDIENCEVLEVTDK